MRIELFERRTLRGKRWYFRVKAANHKVIAQSEAYHNRNDALATATLLRRELFNAELIWA